MHIIPNTYRVEVPEQSRSVDILRMISFIGIVTKKSSVAENILVKAFILKTNLFDKNLFRDPDIVGDKNVRAITRFIEWVAGFSF